MQAVIDELNKKFGNDVKNLSKAQDYHGTLLEKKKDLETKMKHAKGEDPNQIKGLINFARDSLAKMELLENVHCKILNDVSLHLDNATTVKKEFDSSLVDIQKLLRLRQYLQWIAKIEEISQFIDESIHQGQDSPAVAHLQILMDTWKRLKSSECHHLLQFLKQTLLYWHQILKEKFEREFEKVLETMGWPMLNPSMRQAIAYTAEMLALFENAFLNLYRIQLPSDLDTSLRLDNSISTLLPLELMMKPLKKRFLYHFVGKKQTNRIDKPEWYLTQILTWINEHVEFCEKFVQQVLLKAGETKVNAAHEMMRSLVQTAIAKLEVDLPQLIGEDRLLTHTIEEVLLFDGELRNLGYPAECPCILNVLTADSCFIRWIALEKKFADEKRDKLLCSPTAWQCPYRPIGESFNTPGLSSLNEDFEIDELKVPECAEAFMLLLHGMTERYRNLEQAEHVLKFLSLQQILLEDFRLCLQQIVTSRLETSTNIYEVCPVLNGAHYVVVVLNEWSEEPFFLELLEICNKLQEEDKSRRSNSISLSGTETPETPSTIVDYQQTSVFEDVTILLEKLYKDTILTLVDWLLSEIKSKSRAYRREKWFCISTMSERDDPAALTPTAYPMLSLLQTSLQHFHECLAAPLFAMVWQGAARGLSLFIYEDVILENFFSEGGAQQLAFDMNRNLFPLFSPYTQKPENFFKEVKEACVLLMLPRPTAWILQETLKAARMTDVVQGSSALEEQGIYALSPSQAMHVLSKRSDLVNT